MKRRRIMKKNIPGRPQNNKDASRRLYCFAGGKG
jgi:hypothetical protein